jgi:hypothetical protein
MLRNCIVVAALILGLYCIGVIINADSNGQRISLGAPTFIASAAQAGQQ